MILILIFLQKLLVILLDGDQHFIIQHLFLKIVRIVYSSIIQIINSKENTIVVTMVTLDEGMIDISIECTGPKAGVITVLKRQN